MIPGGKGLKKTVTVDKSAPLIDTKASSGGGAGRTVSSGGGGGGGGAAPVMSGSDGPAQQLAGLFAGGMPSLKKTGASAGALPRSYPRGQKRQS